MKALRTDHAKVLGVLGAFGLILSGAFFVLLPGEILLKVVAAMVLIYFFLLAVRGLSARWIALDGGDVLLRKREGYSRIPLAEVVAVRTIPIFRYVGTLSIEFEDGTHARTLVADQDLTWIMAQMPPAAITPYWRRKTGQI